MTDLVARLRLEGTAQGLVAATGQGEQGLNRLNAAGRTAKGGLDAAGVGAAGFERNARGADVATRALTAAIAAIGVRELVAGLKDAAFQAGGFEMSLAAVTGGAAQGRAEMGFVRAEAARLGLDIRRATESFVGLAAATEGGALQGAQTREIWSGVAEAGLALGRSSEQVARGQMAIQQIASKGVVSMEEIRQQLAEAIPSAVNIAARAMGVSTAELNKMVESGKLASDVFLPKFARALREEYGPAIEAYMISPLGRAREESAKLETALFDLRVAGGEGFLAGVLEGLTGLNRELTSDEAKAAVRDLTEDLGVLTGVAAQGIGLLVENADLLKFALVGLAAVKLGPMLMSGVAGATSLRMSFLQTVAAQENMARAALTQAQTMRVASGAMLAGEARAHAVAAAQVNLARATSASTTAALAARSALGGLAAFLGGPFGIAIIAATGLFWVMKAAMEEAGRPSPEVLRERAKSVEAANDYTKASLAYASASGEARTAALREAEAKRVLYLQNLQNAQSDLLLAKNALTKTISFGIDVPIVGDDGLLAASVAQTLREKKARANVDSRAAQVADLEKALAEGDKLIAEAKAAPQLTAPAAAGRSTARADRQEDRARQVADDLLDDAAAAEAYARALTGGAAALDAWRIAEAGRQAVQKLGLADRDRLTAAEQSLIETIRARAEETERLKVANERVEKATGLTRSAERDSAALQRRSDAAAQGERALEALRISEAGLAAVQALGVDSLDQLTGATRQHAEAAVSAAEAKERQALATEKAERVAAALTDLSDRIALQERYNVSVAGGIEAEVAYARAEFMRQEVERAGKTLTDDQVAALRAKAEALFAVQAATDEAEMLRGQTEELRLLQMTTREREIEVRFLERKRQLLAQGLALVAAEARARAEVLAAVSAEEQARALGQLRDDMRKAFVEGGKLSFDEVGDYAEQKLREAVYDALLAKPIDILLKATVQGLDGIAGALGEKLSSVLGGSIGGLIGGGAQGMAMASALGIKGSGNGLTDLALSMGGKALGGMLAGTAAFSAGGALASFGSVLGPLGALAGMALGGLLKDRDRPMATAQIVASGGQFKVGQVDAVDGGPKDQVAQMGEAISASLNNVAAAFGIDVAKIGGMTTTAGYVTGERNFYALGGEGYFGGAMKGGRAYSDEDALRYGVSTSQVGDAQALAEQVVKETILRAIAAGASNLSAAEIAVVKSATNFEEAANKIAAGRSLLTSINDAILGFTDPAQAERKRALDAIEDAYQAMKAQAQQLIAAGLVPAEAMAKIEELKALRVAEALRDLGEAAETATNAFEGASPRLVEWLNANVLTSSAQMNPAETRGLAYAQYDRMLEKARGGDAEALASITRAADTLLKADEAATSSSRERLALFAKVQGDIAGLAGVAVADPVQEAINDLTAVWRSTAAALVAAMDGNGGATVERLAQLLVSDDLTRAAIAALTGENTAVTLATAELVARRLDVNLDGMISASELQAATLIDGYETILAATMAGLIGALTASGDATVAQLAELLYSTDASKAAIAALNGDNSLVTLATAEIVARSIDGNLDGLISAAELQAAAQIEGYQAILAAILLTAKAPDPTPEPTPIPVPDPAPPPPPTPDPEPEVYTPPPAETYTPPPAWTPPPAPVIDPNSQIGRLIEEVLRRAEAGIAPHVSASILQKYFGASEATMQQVLAAIQQGNLLAAAQAARINQ